MDPLAVVTAILAALHVVYGVPPIVAPSAAVVLERRLFYSTPARLRMVGVLLLVPVALPLIATARDARAAHGEVSLWLEGLGWFAAAASVWTIAAPGLWQRLAVSFWDAVDEPALRRAVGVFSVAFGVFLGWIALFVL